MLLSSFSPFFCCFVRVLSLLDSGVLLAGRLWVRSQALESLWPLNSMWPWKKWLRLPPLTACVLTPVFQAGGCWRRGCEARQVPGTGCTRWWPSRSQDHGSLWRSGHFVTAVRCETLGPARSTKLSLQIPRNHASLEEKRVTNVNHDAGLLLYPVSRRYAVFKLYGLRGLPRNWND